MRIVHVFFSYKIGGAELMLNDIMNIQVKEHEVSLLIINDEVDKELLEILNPKIKVYLLRRKKGSKNPFSILKLNWMINSISADIIHCHVLSIAKFILFSRKKMYATKHTTGYFDSSWSKFKTIFAISDSVYNDVLLYGNYNVILAPNGIDIDLIKQKNIDDIDIISDKIKIVTVGRLEHERKGQHILLHAIHALVYKYSISNISVHIIGEGSSLNYLQSLTVSLNLEKYVTFLGKKNRDYIYENLCNYDIYIQPSIFEAFGLSVAEACVAKVPVLVSSVEGPMEVINNGEYGCHFINGDSDSLSDKLKYMIQSYGQVIEKVDYAYEYVKDKYRIENTVAIYNRNYK